MDCPHTPDAHRHWPLGWKVHVDGGLGLTGTTTTRATQHVATLHVWPGMQRMVPLTYPDGHVMPCVPQSVWVATHVLPEHLGDETPVTQMPFSLLNARGHG
jgi:hypothetical protein